MIETLFSLASAAGHDMAPAPVLAARSIENPRVPLSAYFDAPAGSVTEDRMLGVTSAWACIRIIAGAIARTPVRVRRREGGAWLEDESHYAHRLLAEQANPFQTAYRWKQLMTTWVLLHGNAYSMLDIDGRGRVVALWPMRPDRILIEVRGDRMIYIYTRNDGQRIEMDSGLVFHLRGLSTDGVLGLSPLSQFRRTLRLAIGQEEYAEAFYRNGARLSGVLRAPGVLSDDSRKNLIESWKNMYSGAANAHKVALLEEGLEYQALTMPMGDAEFIATRKFGVADFSRIYGVPLHMLGEPKDGGNYSSAEIAQQGFLDSSVSDHATNFEEEAEYSLLSARDRGNVDIEMDLDRLTRADIEKRFSAYEKMRRWAGVNEIRAREGLNPIEGGDEPFVQVQEIPLSMAGQVQAKQIQGGVANVA
jgi:HK97 family phage portal protein